MALGARTGVRLNTRPVQISNAALQGLAQNWLIPTLAAEVVRQCRAKPEKIDAVQRDTTSRSTYRGATAAKQIKAPVR